MRGAPPVTIALRGAPGWHALLWFASLGAAAALLHWGATSSQRPVGLALAAAALWAGISLARSPRGTLRWDGQTWQLDDDRPGDRAKAGRIAVSIDSDRWMLLRFTPDEGAARRVLHARWLAVRAVDSPQHWGAFRAAVHSPRVHATQDRGDG